MSFWTESHVEYLFWPNRRLVLYMNIHINMYVQCLTKLYLHRAPNGMCDCIVFLMQLGKFFHRVEVT